MSDDFRGVLLPILSIFQHYSNQAGERTCEIIGNWQGSRAHVCEIISSYQLFTFTVSSYMSQTNVKVLTVMINSHLQKQCGLLLDTLKRNTSCSIWNTFTVTDARITTQHAAWLALPVHRSVYTARHQRTNQPGCRESVQADSSEQYAACQSSD